MGEESSIYFKFLRHCLCWAFSNTKKNTKLFSQLFNIRLRMSWNFRWKFISLCKKRFGGFWVQRKTNLNQHLSAGTFVFIFFLIMWTALNGPSLFDHLRSILQFFSYTLYIYLYLTNSLYKLSLFTFILYKCLRIVLDLLDLLVEISIYFFT